MRPLILFDLDHTLITNDFLLTTDALPTHIVEMQKRGFSVGINSDRPQTTLEYYYQLLTLDGPIIIERGNAIYLPHDGSLLFHQGKLPRQVDDITRLFLEMVRFQYPRTDIIWGDFLYPEIRHMSFRRARDFLLINGCRRYSFGLNYLHLDATKSDEECDAIAWQKLQGISILLRDAFRRVTDQDPDLRCYMRNNACMAHFPGTEKSRATNYLLEHAFASKIFMIGDTTQDFLGHDHRLIHCAVGNAEAEYKDVCDFVAAGEFTHGVVEALQWIATNK